MTLKEKVINEFKYCNAIAMDIVLNGKSKEVQEYATQFAEIESPLIGGTDANWIRINWGYIYIFLHDDGKIQYQFDPFGEYGGELIDVFGTAEDFIQSINLLEETEIEEYYAKDEIEENPSRLYIPMMH